MKLIRAGPGATATPRPALNLSLCIPSFDNRLCCAERTHAALAGRPRGL